ncbi:hypothetical protein O0L34_g18300 [Tuta absoluta]|nr:hypothetical protein O0L34_g18300 [Tuta absoluta]
MSPLVVLFAVVSVACGFYIPAQPPHHPAVVLDPHGRPLDTAEVINARALHLQAKHLEGHHAPLVYAHAAPLAIAHAAPLVVAHSIPAAVSHQSRVDVHSSPAVVAHAAVAYPLLAHAGLGHYLHKRSLGHYAYAAPVVAHVAPSAVSHQSRVDVISSPAVVSHAVHAAPIVAHAVHAPVVHALPAAVSHQSRVDVRTSHPVVSHAVVAAPVVSHSVVAPIVSAHSAWPAYGHGYGHGLGHFLKKRSLALAHYLPSAVSHQSRVDVISSPAVVSHAVHAAPIAVAHAAPVVVAHAAPDVSHQSRVDYISSHVTPLAHSAVWSAPAAHWAHSPLALSSHW